MMRLYCKLVKEKEFKIKHLCLEINKPTNVKEKRNLFYALIKYTQTTLLGSSCQQYTSTFIEQDVIQLLLFCHFKPKKVLCGQNTTLLHYKIIVMLCSAPHQVTWKIYQCIHYVFSPLITFAAFKTWDQLTFHTIETGPVYLHASSLKK